MVTILLKFQYKAKETNVLILDEIGKMECFSSYFESAVHKLFQKATKSVIVGTVPVRHNLKVVTQITGLPNVEHFTVEETRSRSVRVLQSRILCNGMIFFFRWTLATEICRSTNWRIWSSFHVTNFEKGKLSDEWVKLVGASNLSSIVAEYNVIFSLSTDHILFVLPSSNRFSRSEETDPWSWKTECRWRKF